LIDFVAVFYATKSIDGKVARRTWHCYNVAYTASTERDTDTRHELPEQRKMLMICTADHPKDSQNSFADANQILT